MGRGVAPWLAKDYFDMQRHIYLKPRKHSEGRKPWGEESYFDEEYPELGKKYNGEPYSSPSPLPGGPGPGGALPPCNGWIQLLGPLSVPCGGEPVTLQVFKGGDIIEGNTQLLPNGAGGVLEGLTYTPPPCKCHQFPSTDIIAIDAKNCVGGGYASHNINVKGPQSIELTRDSCDTGTGIGHYTVEGGTGTFDLQVKTGGAWGHVAYVDNDFTAQCTGTECNQKIRVIDDCDESNELPLYKACSPTPTFSVSSGNVDEITKNATKTWTLNNSQGTVVWAVSGSGATITQAGVVTTTNACGTLTITATDSCCGVFTQKVRVTDNGMWVLSFETGCNRRRVGTDVNCGGGIYPGDCYISSTDIIISGNIKKQITGRCCLSTSPPNEVCGCTNGLPPIEAITPCSSGYTKFPYLYYEYQWGCP